MSDLYNQQVSKVEEFNANEYVRSLCKNKKMTISEYCETQFLSGWKGIIEELIISISNYSISLTQITDAYSQLDVSFIVVNKTKEVYVWEAIENVRQRSRLTCASCGEKINIRRKNRLTGMFCESCTKKAGEDNRTGTWLDKY